jgi:hypothetical protein
VTSASIAATSSTSQTAAVGPVACATSQLRISAGTDAASYSVGATPNLALIVTNSGPSPCIADLADPKIELRVYSGSARIWGSHDCQVQPGTSPQVLPVGRPIRREIKWSGLSSQPQCAGVRQRVGAGTYTLIPILNGQQGSTASFVFTG